ncbi:endocuticle structural glycoprotein ABD-5-like [Halyomorpha halys]|uniref:endocuticle structural glycoprotein ABD-5-like n=1 Tax=Halyomorpha halys TaxID=286706 RepID=UPI0006D4FAD4|nr:endocuticle structural glycoprotein SgAbd-2-like [Halyomorpha halys]KAE8574032.1 Cuticle Protein CPR RR-1 [Halyomorpha halys]
MRLSWIVLVFGVGLVQGQQPTNNDVILSSESENNYDGTYKYSYQTSNGISVKEEGFLKNPGTEGEAQTARGSYSYTAPDGQVITVNWYADETGFHAERTNVQGPGTTPAEIPIPESAPEFFRG